MIVNILDFKKSREIATFITESSQRSGWANSWMREVFAGGMWNPGLWHPEFSSKNPPIVLTPGIWNPESKFTDKESRSRVWNPESCLRLLPCMGRISCILTYHRCKISVFFYGNIKGPFEWRHAYIWYWTDAKAFGHIMEKLSRFGSSFR